MKKIPIFLLAMLSFSAKSQTGLDGLVAAEGAFAKMAVEKNTVDAFLANSDSKSIVFEKGKPANAQAVWKARKPSETKLIWQPAFAGIAISGDMGFTTGPWKMESGHKQIACGQFASVWEKDAGGNWKFALDIGIGHDSVKYITDVLTVQSISTESSKKTNQHGDQSFHKAETAFNTLLTPNPLKAYQLYTDEQGIFLRTNELPLLTKSARDSLFHSDIQYALKTEGYKIAASGDFAYVYGTGELTIKKENKTQTVTGAFLRVWMLRNNAWKIVLETISY